MALLTSCVARLFAGDAGSDAPGSAEVIG